MWITIVLEIWNHKNKVVFRNESISMKYFALDVVEVQSL